MWLLDLRERPKEHHRRRGQGDQARKLALTLRSGPIPGLLLSTRNDQEFPEHSWICDLGLFRTIFFRCKCAYLAVLMVAPWPLSSLIVIMPSLRVVRTYLRPSPHGIPCACCA